MIGNSVVIELGAKIFGKITIADGIHIGANSVVNKSFNEPNVVSVGAPARVVGKIYCCFEGRIATPRRLTAWSRA